MFLERFCQKFLKHVSVIWRRITVVLVEGNLTTITILDVVKNQNFYRFHWFWRRFCEKTPNFCKIWRFFLFIECNHMGQGFTELMAEPWSTKKRKFDAKSHQNRENWYFWTWFSFPINDPKFFNRSLSPLSMTFTTWLESVWASGREPNDYNDQKLRF